MKFVRDLLGIVGGTVYVAVTLLAAVIMVILGVRNIDRFSFLGATLFVCIACILGSFVLDKIKKMVKHASRHNKK